VNVRESAIYKKLASRLINSINNIYNIFYQSLSGSPILYFCPHTHTSIFIMCFNIAMLFALAATTQLATAAPAPAPAPAPVWNDKGSEAG
jgi:hypothetical protein